MVEIEALLDAARRGDVRQLTLLLDVNPSIATASNMSGSQPIHAAHFCRQFETFELLLARGVTIDFWLAAELGMLERLRGAVSRDAALPRAFSPKGSTALHGACYWGQVACSRYLLENGADPNALTRDQFLQIAPLGCAVATPDIPNPSDDEETVLELVRLLLDSGADVNGRRKDGLTALHSAAWRGHVKVIRYLLECGADPGIRGYDGSGAHAGQTARDVAGSRGNGEAASLLTQ